MAATKYPRWRIVKRPWVPVPGQVYLTITPRKSSPRRDWVVLYMKHSDAKGYEQGRHTSWSEALKAALENLAYNEREGNL